MARMERHQSMPDLLNGLRGIEPLRQLFWSELNCQRVNEAVSRREGEQSKRMKQKDEDGQGESAKMRVRALGRI
jgi:hypothetical protein